MKKHLYEIKKLDIPAYLKWWFIKKKFAGTLSEVLENLTSPITLTNSLKRKFKIFQVGGNSIQDGVPTPESPVPIQNVKGDVDVKVENKNLCTNENIGMNAPILSNIYGSYTGAITIAVKTTSGTAQVNYRINYEDGTRYDNYVMTTNQANGVWRVANYTATKPIKNIGLYYISAGGTARVAEHIMFLKGTYSTITDADYVSHEGQTVTLQLPEEMEMCKIGDYADKFIKQDEKWYKYKQIMKMRIMPTNVLRIEGNDSTQGYIVLYNIQNKSLNNRTLYCNFLSSIGLGTTQDNSNKVGINNINTDGQMRFRYKTGELTLEGAREFLTNNNVIVQYVRNEPVLEEITDETLINELDSLAKLYSYKGTTHISSDNEPSPTFTIQYVEEEE